MKPNVVTTSWPCSEGRYVCFHRSKDSHANVIFHLWVCYDDHNIRVWTKLIYQLWFWLIFYPFIYTSINLLCKGHSLLIAFRLWKLSDWLVKRSIFRDSKLFCYYLFSYTLAVKNFWLVGQTMAFLPGDFYYLSIFRVRKILVCLLVIFMYFSINICLCAKNA